MGKIIIWAARAVLGSFVFFASVGPSDVGSNLSSWLGKVGADDLPAFVINQSVDQPVALVSLGLFLATLVPWRILKPHLLRDGVVDLAPVSEPAPVPTTEEQPAVVMPPQVDIELLRAEMVLKGERDKKIAEAKAVRKINREKKAAELLQTVENLRPKQPIPPGVFYPMQTSLERHVTLPLRSEDIHWEAYANEAIAKVKANALYCSLNTPEEIERFKTPEAKQEFFCKHAKVDGMIRAIKEWEQRDD